MATVQLSFNIYLTDADRVRELQAQYPDGVIRGPQPAAVEFEAPYQRRDEPFTAPSTRTLWHPAEDSGKFFYDRAVFTVTTGWFWGIFGGNTRYVWIGQFIYSPPTDAGELLEPGAGPNEEGTIPQRRWIDGMEGVSHASRLSSGSGKGLPTRDASRTLEGMGTAIRSAANAFTHQVMESQGGGASTTRKSGQRIYVRIRRFPTSAVPWLYTQGVGGTGSEGMKIYISPTGQMLVYSVVNGGTETLAGVSSAFTLNEWVKLDLFLWLKVPAGGITIGLLKIFKNGVLDVTAQGTVHTSGTAIFDNVTQILNTGSGHSLEMDVDDWIGMDPYPQMLADAWDSGAEYAINDYAHVEDGDIRRYYRATVASGPASGGAVTPPNASRWTEVIGPVDWYAGSHVMPLRPSAFGANHNAVAWVGDVKTLDRVEGHLTDTGQAELTSTTALAVCEVELEEPTNKGAGAVAAVVGVFGQHASGGTLLGFGIQGVTPVGASPNVAQDGTRRWHQSMYRPSALAAPEDYSDGGVVRASFTKANNATSCTMQALVAQAEYIGVWGEEDLVIDPADPDAPLPAVIPKQGVHNGPYPDSPWAESATPVLSPVIIVGGTYTGAAAGVYAAIRNTIRTPVHFLMVRRAAALTDGNYWWSSMTAAHRNGQQGNWPNVFTRALRDRSYVSPGGDTDPEERYAFQSAGNATHNNANATTYQYIAVCDPGMRFLLNGQLAHGTNALDASVINALVDTGFTAVFGFFQKEIVSTPVSTTVGMYLKGSNSSADNVSPIDATELATAMTFGTAGQITSRSGLHGPSTMDALAYALVRAVEPGSEDPGVVFQVRSYTGNGAASRDIALTPVSGKRPLYAIVVPRNAAAHFRDPSHLTNTSSPCNFGATIATGITAGDIDIITVGSTLNSNGIEYSVFVIPGSETAGNGGWSINGEFEPVEPAIPGGSQWPTTDFTEEDFDEAENPTPEPEPEPEIAADQPDLDGTTDLPGTDLFCVDYTQRLMNDALIRIGVSKQIADLLTDTTEEATLARQFVKRDVETTLRRYPWDFATRYADLVLVGGTATVPVNYDWQYSYRAPLSMIFPRRIVPQDGTSRAFHPEPISFREGRDTSGALIFCNAVATDDVPVQLEYTVRDSCPTYFGDVLFNDALTWRFAASFAMALAKDSKKQEFCLGMFERVVGKAETVQANAQQPDQGTTGGDAPWISGR